MRDAIIICPNGFAPALNELNLAGLSEFIKFDAETKQAIGLDKFDRFYPKVPTFSDPALLYVRGNEADFNKILEINPINFKILVVCDVGGDIVETGETDESDLPITHNLDIYAKLALDEKACVEYRKYHDWDKSLPEEEIRTVKTIEVVDENGTAVVDNPKYMAIKPIGCFA